MIYRALALLVVLGGCAEEGEGTDCRESPCNTGFRCVERSADTFRCQEIDAAVPPPALLVEPSEMLFERGEVDQEQSLNLDIRQHGTRPTSVLTLAIEGAEHCTVLTPVAEREDCDFVLGAAPPLPLLLQNGDFRVVPVTHRTRADVEQPTARIVITSNDGHPRSHQVQLGVRPPAPRIGSSDIDVVFVPRGGEQTRRLEVRSIGEVPLRVERHAIQVDSMPMLEGEFTVELDTPPPWDMAPGESQGYTLTYSPMDDSPDEARVLFWSNDPVVGRLEILVSSRPSDADLELEPATLIWATPGEQRLKFRNVGRQILDVVDVTLEQPGMDFSIGEQHTSFELRSEQTQEIFVTYAPMGAGSEGVLVVRTNAANAGENSEIRVPLQTQ